MGRHPRSEGKQVFENEKVISLSRVEGMSTGRCPLAFTVRPSLVAQWGRNLVGGNGCEEMKMSLGSSLKFGCTRKKKVEKDLGKFYFKMSLEFSSCVIRVAS